MANMLMQRVGRLRIATKLQAVVALGFVLGQVLLLSFFTFEHIKNTEHERYTANVRAVQTLSGPVGGALKSQDRESVVYSFMEVLSQQSTAAGLVIVDDGKIIKTQQSLDYLDMPLEALKTAALEAGRMNEDRAISEENYHLVAVPVLDSASRVIGAFAIGWSTKGLLDAVWLELAMRAGALTLLSGLVLFAVSRLVRILISEPVSAVAKALQQGAQPANTDAADLSRYEVREDEVGALASSVSVFLEQSREITSLSSRFHAALTNMSYGLCMFDADRRLVVANTQYAAMYALPSHLTIAGTSLEAILEHRLFLKNAPLAIEQYVLQQADFSAGGHAVVFSCELQDGRTIRISHRPMPGGGYVASHEDVTEALRTAQQIEHMAHHDALTGLPNRVHFRTELDRALAQVRRGEKLAVLCLDLDQFKAVNDTLGHAIGDSLLKAVADRLKSCLRSTDTIARLGGDEFAIVQAPVEQSDEPSLLSQRIIDVLSAPYEIEGHQVVIGTSVGIAFAPTDSECPDQLLRAADMALYKAKIEGRGTYRYFEAEMDARMQKRRALELDLRGALPNGEFVVHYQPLIETHTGEVSGFEALLRWDHPERGRVPPDEFIPLAEEIGLINQIGIWVLKQACFEACTWPTNMRLAVNLSAAQFKSRTLVQDVSSVLKASGFPARRLELEITETVMLQDTEATLATLHQLRGLGLGISMDDFGTGYSSLSFLRKFPFVRIKIDRSFISELPEGRDAAAIVKAVASLSQDLGMSTTAEGVENMAQLEMIRRQGCDEVQGYLFNPALSSNEIAALLPRAVSGSQTAA